MRQPDNFLALDVNLENVRAGAKFAEVEVGVVDPLGVERDVWVGDGAFAALDEDFLLAVGMQPHEVVAGVDVGWVSDLRPGRGPRFAVTALHKPRGPDVDNVVIDLD